MIRPDPSHRSPTSPAFEVTADLADATVAARTLYQNPIPSDPSNAHALTPLPSSALQPNTYDERTRHVGIDGHQPVLPRTGTPPSPSPNTDYAPSVMTSSTLPPSYRTRRSELNYSPLPRYSTAGLSGPPSSFQTQTSDRQRASKPQGPRASGARPGARALHIRNASAGLQKPSAKSDPAENTKSGAEAGC
ncbi:hypothetical protein C8Q76DRAFT_743802, partial [Earliella scabrosa]